MHKTRKFYRSNDKARKHQVLVPLPARPSISGSKLLTFLTVRWNAGLLLMKVDGSYSFESQKNNLNRISHKIYEMFLFIIWPIFNFEDSAFRCEVSRSLSRFKKKLIIDYDREEKNPNWIADPQSGPYLRMNKYT